MNNSLHLATHYQYKHKCYTITWCVVGELLLVWAFLCIKTDDFNKRDPGKKDTEDKFALIFVYKANGDDARKQWENQRG